MNTFVLDFDLVVFGFDLLVNMTHLLWPDRHRRQNPWVFAWGGIWALLALGIFWNHPWAAAVFAADAAASAVLAWKSR